MSTSKDRRGKSWGRGALPLDLESLESRQLLTATATPSLPDITGVTLATDSKLYWGDAFHATGTVINQGTAATTVPFNVGIYASTTQAIGSGAVLLGEATIPAGLAPGAKASFDQVLYLPTTSLPTDASGGIYISTRIDPEQSLSDSNTTDKTGVGLGIDSSRVTIATHGPAQLVGTSLAVSPAQSAWGSTIQLTAQIRNTGQGNAPPTRAAVVLTPSNSSPGSPGDVTLEYINIPELAAGQSTTITQSLILPSIPPPTLAGGSAYTLSIAPDADFLTNSLSPHIANQGLGFDMARLTITSPADMPASPATAPDLQVLSVKAPTAPIALGQSFQVTSNVQNIGTADSGPVILRYVLVGPNGSLSDGIFLKDTTLSGLKVNNGQNITQNLQLPTAFPSGMTLNSAGSAKIAVIVNPDNAVNEVGVTNNVAVSNQIAIQYVDSSGKTVNPTPAPAPPPTAAQLAKQTPAQRKAAFLAAKAATLTAQEKLTIAQKQVEGHSISHNVKSFPTRVTQYFKNLLKL